MVRSRYRVHSSSLTLVRWINGDLSREDGPAAEYNPADKYNLHKSWWVGGKRHRVEGPALIWGDGSKFWFSNNLLHREDGPAIEKGDGTTEWWSKGYKTSPPV